jgi:hypothetical protein
MVSGRFVPTPWTQGLAKALQSITGAYLSKNADTKEREFSKGLVQKQIDAFRGMYGLGQPQADPMAEAGDPDRPIVEEAAPAEQYKHAFSAVPGDRTSLNPAPLSTGVIATTGRPPMEAPPAPTLTPMQELMANVLRSSEESGLPPNAILQSPAVQQQIAALMRADEPRVVAPGASIVQGNREVYTNPKEATPRNRQIVTSGAGVDAQGRPLEVPMIIDPDSGRAMPIEGVLPVSKGPLASATATATNSADGKGFVKIAEAQAGDVSATAQRAKVAQSSITSSIDPMLQAIDSGKVVTGPTADQRVWFRQLGETVGVTGKTNEEVLTNTRTLIQGLANQELDAATRMKGQGQITEAERGIIKRAASGEISSMTVPELRQLLLATRKVNLLTIGQHQQNVSAIRGSQGAPTILPEWDVQSPGAYVPPANKPPSKTPTGKPVIPPGTVSDGYRFKGGNPNDPKSWEQIK